MINAIQELVFPIGYQKAYEYLGKGKKDHVALDDPDAYFIHRIKEEMKRPEFDVSEEYSEMVSQFGYLLLFSCAWPFAAMCCLCNNFLELRSDALKITLTTR
jgi:anoctamin-10